MWGQEKDESFPCKYCIGNFDSKFISDFWLLKTIKYQGKVEGIIFKDFVNSTTYSIEGEFSKDQSISILIQINK